MALQDEALPDGLLLGIIVRMREVRIAIIGLGWPGLRHSEAVLETAGTQLVAAVDANEERRMEYAQLFPGVRLFPDYEEMLLDGQIDAVVICLPNYLHFPVTMAAIRAGKHVLCEKPPTLHAEEMRKVREEALRNSLVYAFSRQMRFHGRMRAAREVVASGSLGHIYCARTRWLRARGIPGGVGGWFLDKSRAGGGVLIDIGIHALDAAWYLMGCPRPTTVSASVSTQFRHYLPQDIHFDVDDTAFAFLRFDNGAVLDLETTWAANLSDEVPEMAPGQREVLSTTLYGQKAGLRLEPLTLFDDRNGVLTDVPLEAEPGTGFVEQMEDFVRAVTDETEPVNNARQALYLMEMLDAMYESSALGREVSIPD